MDKTEEKEEILTPHYDSLTDKDKLLVTEYLTTFGFNQVRTYMSVYSSDNYDTSRTMSTRKFADVNIKNAIKEKLSMVIDEKDDLTRRVIEEYKKLAFSDIRDVVSFDGSDLDFKDFDEIDTSAIKEISCRKENMKTECDKTSYTENMNIKLYNKKTALDSLAKYLGLLVDKVEVDHNIKDLEKISNEMKEFFGNKTSN